MMMVMILIMKILFSVLDNYVKLLIFLLHLNNHKNIVPIKDINLISKIHKNVLTSLLMMVIKNIK